MNLAETLKGARWVVTGTPVDQPYPCRCDERRGDRCSVKWCPCVGRLDRETLPPTCCAQYWGPEDFTAAWRAASQ